MDIFWQNKLSTGESSGYKESVLQTQNGVKDTWNDILSMGRPMWKTTFDASMNKYSDEGTATATVFSQAAQKLLVGKPPIEASSYDESTLFGVAAMLCRLGLRPYSRSALASRAVADFMAILAFVNYENDGQLSSYASDPVLSLGATKVWYALSDSLSQKILPQFKKLLFNETLDTGGVGEVIARIMLLLAVDTCVAVEEAMAKKATKRAEGEMKEEAMEVVEEDMNTQGNEINKISRNKCEFKGQFVSVRRFMEALAGPEPVIKRNRQTAADSETVGAFRKWQKQWTSWQVGFCHFMQLVLEPTEETLWALLGRRAAGVFPRNQNGADLVIPMFSGSMVSCILVQVKNVTKRDSGFPESATIKCILRTCFLKGTR